MAQCIYNGYSVDSIYFGKLDIEVAILVTKCVESCKKHHMACLVPSLAYLA